MVSLTPAVRDVLTGPALAHVVTIDPDGAPQVSCVWAGLDGDEVVFASFGLYRKIRNLQRDPRVAISWELPEDNPAGMQLHLVVHGTARVEEGGAPELLAELARVRLGPDSTFPPVEDPPPGYVVRIAVDRVSGIGPWVD